MVICTQHHKLELPLWPSGLPTCAKGNIVCKLLSMTVNLKDHVMDNLSGSDGLGCGRVLGTPLMSQPAIPVAIGLKCSGRQANGENIPPPSFVDGRLHMNAARKYGPCIVPSRKGLYSYVTYCSRTVKPRFSEVWYRACFGCKRPWVRIPQSGPCRSSGTFSQRRKAFVGAEN